MLDSFKMNENDHSHSKKLLYREVLIESIITLKNSMHNNKLILLEDSNDIKMSLYVDDNVRNVTAIYDVLKGYANKFEQSLENVKNTLDDVLSHLHSDFEDEKINFVLSNIDRLRDLSDDDLDKIKFTMPSYTVNTDPINYVDIDGLVRHFYDLLDRTITSRDISELDNEKNDFLSNVKRLAVMSNTPIDLSDVSFRTYVYNSLRDMREYSAEYSLSQDMLNKLEDAVTCKCDYEKYVTQESARLKNFINGVYKFAQEVTNGRLLNDNLNPTVSINKANWMQSRLDNNSDNFDLVKNYVIKLFEIFTECIDIYMTAVTETCIAYKDKIIDAADILLFAIKESNESFDDNVYFETQQECTYYSDMTGLISDVLPSLNESICKLSTIEPIGIINESTEVLNEAIMNKSNTQSMLDIIQTKINQLTDKFVKLVGDVTTANKQWLEQIQNFDTNLLKSNKTLSITSYPYWDGLKKLRAISIPEYNERDVSMILTDKKTYIQKYFRTIPSNISDLKVVLQGGPNEIIYDGYKLLPLYKNCMDVVNNFQKIANQIRAENKKLSSVLNDAKLSAKSLNESAMVYNSIYADNLYSSLLEASNGPITTADLEKANNPDDNGSPQNKITAIREYVILWYGVNAARMDILEKGYNECVGILHKCTRTNKVSKNADRSTEKRDNKVVEKVKNSKDKEQQQQKTK